MAGLGRRVFSAGEVLTAANVNGYLMDQSVMVFADSTARSSAIGTPTEGMVTYLEDDNELYKWTGAAWVNVTNSSIPKSTVTTAGDLIVADGSASVTRLGIGTNGQILTSNGTTATWATPSSGGMTLISTTSLSGSSVSLTSIPGAYNHLQLIIRDYLPNTDGENLKIALNGETGNHINTSVESSNNPRTFGATANLNRDQDDTVAGGATVVNIYDYANTTSWKAGLVIGATTYDADTTKWSQYHAILATNLTAAITSIQLSVATGSITSGTALLYGVN